MEPKSKINIVSKFPQEYSSTINVDNIDYLVQTEDLGLKSHKISAKIYLKGEIVFSKKFDYSHLTKLKDFQKQLADMMEKQHKFTIDNFVSEQNKKHKAKSEYFDEIQQLLRRGNGQSALDLLRDSIEKFPADPFLLSYYGCLIAIVENKHKEGIRICREALKILNNTMAFGSEFFYPVFYLNLGRAYLSDNKKKDALSAFNEGLKHDAEHHEILWELRKLGIRTKSLIPFLKRSNPINKYIGLLLSSSLNKKK